MWKRLSEELPENFRGVLCNERDDEVYEMDLSGHDDYEQLWWCELRWLCELPGRSN